MVSRIWAILNFCGYRTLSKIEAIQTMARFSSRSELALLLGLAQVKSFKIRFLKGLLIPAMPLASPISQKQARNLLLTNFEGAKLHKLDT